MSSLHCIRAGQGPVFVMLHGLFGDADNFRSVSLHMERHLDVLRFDLPGHGKSPSLPTLSIEAMADAVVENLISLNIEHCHLLGHSLGGKVAMSLAARHASIQLRSLCVVDIAPKLYPPHHDSIIQALQSINLDELAVRKDAEAQLRPLISDAGVRAFLLKSLYQNEDKRFSWRFDLQQLANDYSLIRQPPVIEKPIAVPTLFIKGALSDYLQPEDESTIKQLFSQPSLKIIPGTNHWLHAEKPAQFARICEDFVQANQG